MRPTLLTAVFLLSTGTGAAQAPPAAASEAAPWFRLTLPASTSAGPAVLVGARPPRPVALPAGDSAAAEFNAATIKADVETIVEFARDNERSRDFSDCGTGASGAAAALGWHPCFNIGGRDGWFLEALLDRATQASASDQVRAQIELKTETFRGLKATNAVAVIPGKSSETIVLNAHVDGWFDGAGDNADGLAVLVALARHYGKPGNAPARTLVFVASAGHHTPGINGPRSFVAANPELANPAVMLVNIEHVAQRNFSPGRTTSKDGCREAVADSGEAPIAVGVTNGSPFLQALVDRGPSSHGVNFISERSTFQSGETGGWADLKVAKVSLMQAPPLYHTTGEVLDVISTPGLERIARFLAFFVSAVDGAPRERINP